MRIRFIGVCVCGKSECVCVGRVRVCSVRRVRECGVGKVRK